MGERVFVFCGCQPWRMEAESVREGAKSFVSARGFSAAKRRLLWMQSGGEDGMELDDILVAP